MPKKDNKRLGDDPFERFLPQIQDSRKKKDEHTSDGKSDGASAGESKSVSKSTNKSKSADASKSTSASNGESASTSKVTSNDTSIIDDTITSKSTRTSTITDTSKSAAKSEGVIESADESAEAGAEEEGVTGSGEAGAASESMITIPKRKKTSILVKMTHYFRPDQLEAIDELHERSGRDKSELVRIAVDNLIERAKVE